MAGNNVWFAGTRWRPGVFLTCHEANKPPEVPQEGWVGVDLVYWGIALIDRRYATLTHLPTGLRAGCIPRLDDAADVAARLDCLPFHWAADTPDVIGLLDTSHLSAEEAEFYKETVQMLRDPPGAPTSEPEPRKAKRAPRRGQPPT